ncbi:unnamed protein product [Oppiella nova]|uniref:NADP-dependent oxidoreductase domain-containing protein n=1 Tax=Oppiella nova TaxID=334625 RepID=A0A7R9QNJ8_9ACAR|nr:unnamed protein product [Oppiella nova]CAG2168817.1 unnamed protein product [Oppiella nova]
MVHREDLFIVTKVWNNFHSRERVVESISLQPTGVRDGDGLHPTYPNGSVIPRTWDRDVTYLEAYKGLKDTHNAGLVKSIGVSNFNEHQLTELIKHSQIKPAVNQIEVHPHFNQQKLIDFCRGNNITVTAYMPLAHGRALVGEPVLNAIADKYRKSVAQVVLRWHLQRGLVAIPKSGQSQHIDKNFDVFNFELNDQDMSNTNAIAQKPRINQIPPYRNHPDYPCSELMESKI